jgi:thiamine-phosphate pyrophosphorylase
MSFVTDILLPSLTLVTNRTLYRPEAGDGGIPLSLVEAAIAGGVDTVQLRVPRSDPDDLGLYAVALRLREMTAGKARFIMTGHVELAEKCHADGLLLPERSYKPSDARNYLRQPVRLVGMFVQSVPGAGRAERGGADYVHVGPVFGESGESGRIVALLRKIKDAVHIPVIAIGGIETGDHIVECIRAGADGVAVTNAITQAPDPQAAAVTLRAAMDAAWAERTF